MAMHAGMSLLQAGLRPALRRFALAAALAPVLGGCTVIAVVDTAASVAVGTVGLAADAAIGTVRLTGKAVGAAADAVLPASK